LATDALANFQSDGVDIAVRQTKPPFSPGLRGELLFPATIMAVCSPRFVARNPISTASDLTRNVLLHDSHGLWPVFLERAGVPDNLRETKSFKFSHTSLAIDAAIASQGIALASEELVTKDIVAGRLVSPLDFRLRDDLGFYIVYPRSSRKAEHVQWMKEWLLQERALATDNAPDFLC
jgi:LysR family transcriptional regulator, glycine cleavage system transcriptional activator